MPFFVTQMPDTVTPVVWVGGSITDGATASDYEKTSYRALTREWLNENKLGYAFVSYDASVGGTPSWYGLVRLQADVLDKNPALVFVDFAVNDSGEDSYGDRTDGFAPAAEALIRRLYGSLTNPMLVGMILCWPDGYSHMTAARRAARDKWIALLAHYSIPVVRFDTGLTALLPDPYNDADVEAYFAGVANVHPDDDGHNVIYDLTTPQLATLAGTEPGTLPARYYAESEDYEQTPIIRVGTDNDGETGTGWATSGTARQSSTADDTISWTGTFCSFGLDTNYSTGAGTLAWSVDGGAYTNVDLSAFGVDNWLGWNFTRGAHTVTIKVVSGLVKINRFLAI